MKHLSIILCLAGPSFGFSQSFQNFSGSYQLFVDYWFDYSSLYGPSGSGVRTYSGEYSVPTTNAGETFARTTLAFSGSELRFTCSTSYNASTPDHHLPVLNRDRGFGSFFFQFEIVQSGWYGLEAGLYGSPVNYWGSSQAFGALNISGCGLAHDWNILWSGTYERSELVYLEAGVVTVTGASNTYATEDPNSYLPSGRGSHFMRFNLAPVPEPVTSVALGLGIIALLKSRKTRRD